MKIFLIFFLISLNITNVFANINTTARQALLIDANSGKVLFQKNSDQKISPASMTKIMTTIVAFDLIKRNEISIDENFIVSNKAIIWQDESLGAKYDIVDIPEDLKEISDKYRQELVETAVEQDE